MNNTSNKHLIGQRFLFDPCDNSLTDQWEDHELIRLGSNESRALSLLIAEPGAIISRTRLHDFVWREQGFEVDDSSLTQAISTLRKALKDSTKSPGFIKTVPKRGYQMIASVRDFEEASAQAEPVPVADGQPESPPADTTEAGAKTADSVSAVSQVSDAVANAHFERSASGLAADVLPEPPPQTLASSSRPKWALLSLALLSLACILPLLVNHAAPPKSDAFTPWFTVNNIQILTPSQHPDLASWQPMITACVKTYLDYHPDAAHPIEVIATGGQGNQLWLNYIHPPSMAQENVTLRLHTSQEDNTQLCQ
ncbi:transcriptional regulator [Photobacterium sp. TY1-4]|uniref:winged helix-turn-helix domain-containing protein n=1 Tax=Photobacterium sp. TY1-4 TaxID=2899122 RepID=UPI0021C1251D|nr:transcriptional regulator [Photobacterium sp. TY1-4]UXI02054.1 transcriptional regulator [Photobacterium sp. TY1-4]